MRPANRDGAPTDEAGNPPPSTRAPARVTPGPADPLPGPAASRDLRRLSLAAAAWALLYAGYRAYYAFGGTVGRFGVPADEETWRLVNLAGVVPLLAAVLLPLVALRLWQRPRARRVLLGVAWVITVGCVMHGLVDEAIRLLSLAGALEVAYPPGFWLRIDRQAADLQDILLNEPWFIVEGLLWAAIAWRVLGTSRARRWWLGGAVVGIALLTAIGMLSAAGLIGSFVVL